MPYPYSEEKIYRYNVINVQLFQQNKFFYFGKRATLQAIDIRTT